MNITIQELFARSAQAAAEKRWPDAVEAMEMVLAMSPGHPRALLQLSGLNSRCGRYRLAHRHALQALRARPTDPSDLRDLVARLRTFNEGEAILGLLHDFPPRRLDIPTLLAFAAQLSYLNLQERALVLLDEARRGDPDHPPTLIARGQVLTYLGRFDEAQADLERAVKRAPELATAWWALSRLRRQTVDSNHVDAIRRQLSRPGRRAEDVATLAYALHKELDDLGEFEPAWQALELACNAKRSTLRHAMQDTRALVDALIASPGGAAASMRADDTPMPVFIVGMHRSGTTLLEQLLSNAPQVAALGELYDFPSQMRHAADHHCRGAIDATLVARAAGVDFDAVGEGYLRGIAWRLHGERAFIDKLPTNFFHIGFILRALPDARILHLRREPMETCFSNLRELFSDANPHSYDQHELADYHRQYRRLMAHWHARHPGRILDVDYAALTREPEATMRAVSAFCGLPFDPAMLDTDRARGVATASAVQVRGGIRALARPKWQAYERWLGPLQAALQG